MFGKNKILSPEVYSGQTLDIVEIFPTIQGEGPYVGYPAVFIRLGGCNLSCKFCDTEFDSYKKIPLDEIIIQVQKFAKGYDEKLVRRLVVITGGEPMRQPIERLCEELIGLKFFVQIETNGTVFRSLPSQIKIICSPKNINGRYYYIRPDLLKCINAFKFIISRHNKDYYSVSEVGQSKFKTIVYIQPMDEYDEIKNQANLNYAVELCNKYGYFLSLQTHKLLGLK